MEKPLVVGFVRDRSARSTLQRVDGELLTVPSISKLATVEFPRPPRLFVIQAAAGESEEIRDVVAQLRRKWPLTDVLVWMVHAGGAVVRTFFRAGVKDVVLSRTATKLAECVEATLHRQVILPRLNELSRQRTKGGRFEALLSRSTAMWDLFELCAQVAPADATVLIVGETGTGKELLARAVHRRSGRQGRFVAANCASIAPELISSELFGHEKGAFTGADRPKKGLVMHADGGTLFLDEIGDMPPEAQQSLLRMLQEKQVRAVGSLVETEIDVRVVSATNVLLDQAVQDGAFRDDLFYRLDVIRMNVPSLRERPEDILFLFGHFAKKLARHYGLNPPTFSDGFLDALVEYDWPGNVRQLENFSERLVLARPQRALAARDFTRLLNNRQADIGQPNKRGHASARSSVDTSKSLEDNLTPLIERFERDYLESILKQQRGRISETAKQAGISRRTLLRKLSHYQIDKRDFKD